MADSTAEVLSPPRAARATRYSLKRIIRLTAAGGYDEVVRVANISASGIRLLLPRSPSLDLATAEEMELHFRAGDTTLDVPVTFVRVAGENTDFHDVAFRFTGDAELPPGIAENIGSRVWT